MSALPEPFTPLSAPELEFENGRLVKVRGIRPDYMDGVSLIRLVKLLGAALYEEITKREAQ